MYQHLTGRRATPSLRSFVKHSRETRPILVIVLNAVKLAGLTQLPVPSALGSQGQSITPVHARGEHQDGKECWWTCSILRR